MQRRSCRQKRWAWCHQRHVGSKSQSSSSLPDRPLGSNSRLRRVQKSLWRARSLVNTTRRPSSTTKVVACHPARARAQSKTLLGISWRITISRIKSRDEIAATTQCEAHYRSSQDRINICFPRVRRSSQMQCWRRLLTTRVYVHPRSSRQLAIQSAKQPRLNRSHKCPTLRSLARCPLLSLQSRLTCDLCELSSYRHSSSRMNR